jgi:hypothetical protein
MVVVVVVVTTAASSIDRRCALSFRQHVRTMQQQDVKEWLASNLKECITTPAGTNTAEATAAAQAAAPSALCAACPSSAPSCAAESRDGDIVALSELDGDDLAELCLLGRSVIRPCSCAFPCNDSSLPLATPA